jgi:hypothetical protein
VIKRAADREARGPLIPVGAAASPSPGPLPPEYAVASVMEPVGQAADDAA